MTRAAIAGVLVTILLWAAACGEDTTPKRLADSEAFWEAVEANDKDAALALSTLLPSSLRPLQASGGPTRWRVNLTGTSLSDGNGRSRSA
jgi:hypothetical protein